MEKKISTLVSPESRGGIEEGVFARYDPKSKKLVGLTVVNFSKKFGVTPKEIAIPEFA